MSSLTWPASVDIREVGPRDGLQIEAPLSTAAKIRLLDALAATGVGRIEATAFVSPRAVPAMADAEEVGAYIREVTGPEWSALVASPNGARRAIDAGLRMIEYVISASDGHSQANARRTTDEAVAAVSEVAEVVHGAGGRFEVIIATAWDCPFDGPTPPERTTSVASDPLSLALTSCALATPLARRARREWSVWSTSSGRRPAVCHSAPTSTTPEAWGLRTRSPRCRRGSRSSTHPWEAWVAVRSRPEPAAISRRRNLLTCSKTRAFVLEWTSTRCSQPRPLPRSC